VAEVKKNWIKERNVIVGEHITNGIFGNSDIELT
jgi:hypothetical protein